jgi:DNA uptake protein ComE-like DNA-binding protein
MTLLKIISDARPDLGYIIIDQKDFNPSIHQQWTHKQEKDTDEPIVDHHASDSSVPDSAQLSIETIAESAIAINDSGTGVEKLTQLDGVGKSTAEQIITMRSEKPLTLEMLQTKFPRIKWGELNLIF